MHARRQPRTRRGTGSDRGETLVEVLAAVVILGIAGVAILAGLQLSVKSSDLGRKQANGGAYVRSLAESIQNHVADDHYTVCGTNYLSSAYVSAASYPTAYQPGISVKVWTNSGWQPCTNTLDTGVQRLELTMKSPDAAGSSRQIVERLAIIVRKPCGGAPGPNAC